MSLHFSRLAATSAPRLVSHLAKLPTLSSKAKNAATIIGRSKFVRWGGLGVASCGVAQYYLGTKDDFFDHRFITNKKPEDLAEFYGTEEFMEVFCVLPFMVQLMMRGGEFDDEGIFHTWGLSGPGNLEVSVDFDEIQEDSNEEGEPSTIAWFNKREHFEDVIPFFGKIPLWNMTQNFGYKRLDDGTCEVYHHGEHFDGIFPMRFLFQIHSNYVFWATKRYIESETFGTEDLEDEAEIIRQNVPLFAFKDFLKNLKQNVEKARDENLSHSLPTERHDETIQKLSDLMKENGDENTLPHFRTIRRRHTTLRQLQLVVDDKETKETIATAMAHVGEMKGMRNEPTNSLNKLQQQNQQRKA